ncbi:MAG: hypothetical protein ACO3SO_05635 [Luteolibacter sp.]
MSSNRYCVAGRQSWNREHFDEQLRDAEGDWDFASNEEELAALLENGSTYRYIFFLHWSSKVTDDLIQTHECVCFHMTDVPYGRGGSPLQNLIARGHKDTMLTALKMTEEFDAGPVYKKRPLSL